MKDLFTLCVWYTWIDKNDGLTCFLLSEKVVRVLS